MAFRANEAAAHGYERVKNYLIPRQLNLPDRQNSEEVLAEIVSECGPAVEGYPTWHPLVNNRNARDCERYLSDRCGYKGLDHIRCLANGFMTCTYGDGQEVIDSVEMMPNHPAFTITAERMEALFFAEGTTTILVRCNWVVPLEPGNLIPRSLAVPLMLEWLAASWRDAQFAETWEVMLPYLLGEPHGRRSSLFVSQETALLMKKIYLSMVESGMYGVLYGR